MITTPPLPSHLKTRNISLSLSHYQLDILDELSKSSNKGRSVLMRGVLDFVKLNIHKTQNIFWESANWIVTEPMHPNMIYLLVETSRKIIECCTDVKSEKKVLETLMMMRLKLEEGLETIIYDENSNYSPLSESFGFWERISSHNMELIETEPDKSEEKKEKKKPKRITTNQSISLREEQIMSIDNELSRFRRLTRPSINSRSKLVRFILSLYILIVVNVEKKIRSSEDNKQDIAVINELERIYQVIADSIKANRKRFETQYNSQKQEKSESRKMGSKNKLFAIINSVRKQSDLIFAEMMPNKTHQESPSPPSNDEVSLLQEDIPLSDLLNHALIDENIKSALYELIKELTQFLRHKNERIAKREEK